MPKLIPITAEQAERMPKYLPGSSPDRTPSHQCGHCDFDFGTLLPMSGQAVECPQCEKWSKS